jgi:hypothetical protein
VTENELLATGVFNKMCQPKVVSFALLHRFVLKIYCYP